MKRKINICIQSIVMMGILLVLFGSCTKKDDDENNSTSNTSGTVSDIDGNVYKTITIGSQVWMAENLKTTKYNNSIPIPEITDATDWYNLSTGAYCNYDNNPINVVIYGRLYNWYAVNTGNLCPAGWHIPTEAEWTTLENFLGDPATAGGKLKETGTSHWQSPNTAATNTTGFTGLPGGFRSSTGSFYSLTYNGYWWSAAEGSDTSYARYHYLDFNLGGFYKNEDYKVDGLSVRCIKD